MDNENNQCHECVECKHEEWIKAWQKREQRRDELFQKVKANVITWAVMGSLAYFGSILFQGVLEHVKK